MRMSRKTKKFMSMSLAAVLSATLLLSGCGGKGGEKNSTGSTGSAKTSQTGTQSEKRGHITVSVYDRGNIPSSEGTVIDNRWTKWINENGPVDVSYVAIPRSDPGQKFGILFASGSAPDLCLEYDPTLKQPYYQQGLMMPIGDLIEKYSTTYKEWMEQNPALEKVGTMDDGKLYQFGRIMENAPLDGLYIRKDWLDKLNLKVPTTIDELVNVAKAFTGKDLNGTGKADSIGFAEVLGGETSRMIFGFNTPASKIAGFPYTIKNGELVYDTKPLVEWAKFRKAIYDANACDKEFLMDKNGAKARQDITAGKVGIICAQENQMIPDLATLKKNIPSAEIVPIELPDTPVGKFDAIIANTVQAVGFINSKCQDPQSVIKYMDFMALENTKKALKFGIEDTHYKMVNDYPQIIDADKYKTEVSYTGDLYMACSREVFNNPHGPYDLTDPIQKGQSALWDADRKTYFNTKIAYPGVTYSEHIPALSNDMAKNYNSIMQQLTDIWNKSIISGSAYTPEQAEKDMNDLWNKTGGNDINSFYADWYKNKKESSILSNDLYQLLDKEIADRKLSW